MPLVLAENWGMILVRGILAVLFGIVAFLIPGATILALVWTFGAYALLDGIFSITAAVRGAQRHERWGVLIVEGILDILAAIAAILWPGLTAVVLVFLIGAWAIITGIAEVAAAIRLRRVIHGEWLLGLGGIASIVLGVLLLLAPAAGALAVVWWIGAWALVFGILMIVLAFRLRGLHHHGATMTGAPHPA